MLILLIFYLFALVNNKYAHYDTYNQNIKYFRYYDK